MKNKKNILVILSLVFMFGITSRVYADQCCIFSTNKADYGVKNCTPDIVPCQKNVTGTIKSVNCNTLVECGGKEEKKEEKKEGGAGSTTITFPNPLKFNTIEEVLTSLMSNLQAIIATIALIFIVIGGLFIISAGTSKRVEDGKKMITYALIGLAIVLAAPTFLREIKIILGAGDTGTGLRAIDIAKNVLVFLLSLLGVFAIITMVIGGLQYLTAYGDEKRMQNGKKTATYAVIGIAVALSGVILIKQVVELLQ